MVPLDLFEIGKDVVTAAAAATVAVVAIVGLRTWRRQLKGKTEYELSRRLLRATYALREEFNRVRNPLMLGAEIATAFEEAEVDPKSEERLPEVVYDYRWRFLQRALNDLNLESLEAEVLWGPEADKPLQPLRECAGDLWAALGEYVSRGEEDTDRERLIQLRRTIHGGGQDDPLAKRLEMAVEGIERFVRPHLKL